MGTQRYFPEIFQDVTWYVMKLASGLIASNDRPLVESLDALENAVFRRALNCLVLHFARQVPMKEVIITAAGWRLFLVSQEVQGGSQTQVGKSQCRQRWNQNIPLNLAS